MVGELQLRGGEAGLAPNYTVSEGTFGNVEAGVNGGKSEVELSAGASPLCPNGNSSRKKEKQEWYQKNKPKVLKRSREYHQKYRERHCEQMKRSDKKRHQSLKMTVLHHYSNGMLTCAACGFADSRALSIDHVESNGAAHRRIVGAGSNLYKWLVDNNFPPGYQVLCMNCQWIKRYTRNEFSRRKRKKQVQLESFSSPNGVNDKKEAA